MNVVPPLDNHADNFHSVSTTPVNHSFAHAFAPYASSSAFGLGVDRRPSIPESEASLFLPSHGTSVRESLSPMTPFSPDMVGMAMISGHPMDCKTAAMDMHETFPYNDPTTDVDCYHWTMPEAKHGLPGHRTPCAISHHCAGKQLREEAFLLPEQSQSLVTGASLQSSLSRSIFQSHQPSDGLLVEHMTHWRPSLAQTPPRTVAPSATFQPMFPSSPAYRVTPSTPIRGRYENSVTPATNRSPYSLSPAYRPSDQPVFVQEEPVCRPRQPRLVRTLIGSKGKGSSRAPRKTAVRKESCRSGRVAKSGTGGLAREYPYYIEKNSFACTAEDCVDKNGKRKKFKRQEHLKRHQRTCHTGNRPHFCWVPGCTTKPFSRTDNLNSHLLKTHGKKSPAARNRYIATLDPKSGVFDLDYRGPFTESGWPVEKE